MSIWPQAMSKWRPSSDSDLVRPVIACLAAPYGAALGRGVWAEMDPLLMMRPPRGCWVFIRRTAPCAHKNAPVRFVSMTLRHCTSESSSNGTPGTLTPALLNKTSNRPNTSLMRAKSARTEDSSVTSVGTTSQSAAGAPDSCAVAWRASGLRPARTTAYPARSRPRAQARPMPDPAPVTRATRRGVSIRPSLQTLCAVPSQFAAYCGTVAGLTGRAASCS